MAVECEFQWYAKLKGAEDKPTPKTLAPIFPAGIVSVELQEQFQMKLVTDKVEKAVARSRMKTPCDGLFHEVGTPSYHFEHKVALPNTAGQNEPYLAGTEEVHLIYKTIGSGLVKYRVSYPCVISLTDVHGVVTDYETLWEVDVFVKPDTYLHEWVKVDVEIPEEISEQVIYHVKHNTGLVKLSAFPLPVVDMFDATYGFITPENQARVDSILAQVRH